MRPDDGVRNEVIRWHRDTVSFPTWKETLEVEYLRRFGGINMFTGGIVARARELGLKNAVEWLGRLKKIGLPPTNVFAKAVRHYQHEHGSLDEWPLSEIFDKLV